LTSVTESAGVCLLGDCVRIEEVSAVASAVVSAESSIRCSSSDTSVGVPVTMSASQSPRPPRAQSIAVCGL